MNRAVSLVPVLVLGLAGCGAASTPITPAADAAAPTPGITARGTGTVRGTPDTMTIVLGVQTRAAGARAALDDNSGRATALIDALKGKGVAPADLQTSRLSINPTYDNSSRITGYEVSNQVTATLHDIPAAGAVIDAASEAAGDAVRVQQLGFSIDDDGPPRAQARAEAVRQGQTQATQLAEAAGVTLGPIRTITEVPETSSVPYPMAADRAAASAAPVEPGTQELSVVVEIVYGIDG